MRKAKFTTKIQKLETLLICGFHFFLSIFGLLFVFSFSFPLNLKDYEANMLVLTTEGF